VNPIVQQILDEAKEKRNESSVDKYLQVRGKYANPVLLEIELKRQGHDDKSIAWMLKYQKDPLRAEIEGAPTEPWMLPIEATVAGAVVGGKIGGLPGAVVGGAAGLISEVATGIVGEKVGEKHPYLAFPAAIVTGIIAGGLADKAIRRGATRIVQTTGKIVHPQTVAESIEAIKEGARRGLPVPFEVMEEINSEIPRLTGREFSGRGQRVGLVGISKDPKVPLPKWKKHLFEFFWPYSTVNGYDELLKARGKVKGFSHRSDEFVTKLFKKLEPFDSDTSQDIFMYLDGRLSLEDIRLTDARPVAKQMKWITERIGKAGVNAGVFSQGVYDAHKGKYIKYLYAKHIFGPDGVDMTMTKTQAGPKMDWRVITKRENMTLAQKKAYGLLEDAQLAVPVGMGQALEDIGRANFHKVIHDTGNVFDSKIDVPGYGSMDIDEVASEIKNMKPFFFSDRYPKEPEMVERFNNLNIAFDEFQKGLLDSGYRYSDLARMPNKPIVWGALSDKLVPKPIYDDIIPLEMGTDAWSRAFYQISGTQKIAKVALSPPTMVRNMVANIGQINMSGIPLKDVLFDIIPTAGKSMKTGSRNYIKFKRLGGFKTNWVESEINEVMETWSNEVLKRGKGSWASVPGALKKLSKFYGKIDDFYKLGIFEYHIKNGMNDGDAFLEAMKWGMDYSLAPRSIKTLSRKYLPFVTYQYKIAPLMYESLRRSIERKQIPVMMKYPLIPHMVAAFVRDNQDISEDEWDKMMQDLPTVIKDSRSYMVSPWKSPEGNWQWVNLEYFFPWGNWFKIMREVKQGEILDAIGEFGLNPILEIAKTFTGITRGRTPIDQFTGEPIYNQIDSPGQKMFKTTEFIYNKFAPGWMTKFGPAYYTYLAGEKIFSDDEQAGKDKWGRTITPEVALARWLGVNVTAVSGKQIAAIRQKQVNDITDELKRIIANPKTDDEDRKKALKYYRKMMEEILGRKQGISERTWRELGHLIATGFKETKLTLTDIYNEIRAGETNPALKELRDSDTEK